MKRLVLRKETLASLTQLEAQEIRGGDDAPSATACTRQQCTIRPSDSTVLTLATVAGGCSAQTYCQQASCACSPKTGASDNDYAAF
jgi:hypothetical protein